MISETEIILRVAIAALLGGIIGIERERQGQPAGLRTHMILVIGSALAMALSINLALQFQPVAPNGDPARLAAQVISGIGFLGAGAILRYGVTIKGLTTATSMWTMAIVGLVVGSGYYAVGACITLMILLVLYAVNKIEKKFIHPYAHHLVLVSANDRKSLLPDLQNIIREVSKDYETPTIEKNLRSKKIRVEINVKLKQGLTNEDLITQLSKVDGVRDIRIE